MTLSADAFGWMARALRNVADTLRRRAASRSSLEGGYDLVALEAGLLAATRGIVEGTALEIARDRRLRRHHRATQGRRTKLENRPLSALGSGS